MKISDLSIRRFEESLKSEGKAENTVEKYIRDVRVLQNFAAGRELSRQLLFEYRSDLTLKYKISSVNSMVASANKYLKTYNLSDCTVPQLRVQRNTYIPENRELTKEEYLRLVDAGKMSEDKEIPYIMETIASTGIRISELKFVTVEAVKEGEFVVTLKGKTRTVMLTDKMREKLVKYCEFRGIETGPVFEVSRSSVWRKMKKLCGEANVAHTKVYPHNLRHLFARCFYSVDNDIVRLADVLGHSNINTTHIYIMSSGREHRALLEKLDLVTEDNTLDF